MSAQALLKLGAIGAHAKQRSEGFRQRDVKFLIDLFLNWVVAPVERTSLDPLHNTQVLRFLESLLTEGHAKKLTRKGAPTYKLTRSGFLDLVSQLHDDAQKLPPDLFYLVIYFMKSYRTMILDSVEEMGQAKTQLYRIELEERLDTNRILQSRLAGCEKEIAYWSARIEEGKIAASYATDLKREGSSDADIAKLMETNFPYELNFQKPLSELLNEVRPDLQFWEVTTGNIERSRIIWERRCDLLKAERLNLLALKDGK
ncbi:MAG: hypothetical protein EOP05_10245 [Proteobacteria bacterium]|nr:MAG: hypothetical protein EOP05_10245 [Pseudomonadota bacterium]